jgi:group I intron endonuclease
MNKICIYKITNVVNGKVYVGQTINYDKRKNSHISKLINGTHHNEHLQKSFNIHGIKSFAFEVIKECYESELDLLEIKYIKELDAINNGYNLMHGGQANNRYFSKETREKMSNARKGMKFSDSHREKLRIVNLGKKMSIESINKNRESHLLINSNGEKNNNAVISDKVAFDIVLDLINGFSVNDLSEKYSVSKDIVYNLLYFKSYKHILVEERIKLSNINKKMLNEKIEKAIELYSSGYSQNEISKILKISRNTIRRELLAKNINTKLSKNQYSQANTEIII